MKKAFSRKVTYALMFAVALIAIPVVAVAEGLNDWNSAGSANVLSLSAAPGEAVSRWAPMSIEWRSNGTDGSSIPDVDEAATNLPAPHAVSAMAVRLPSPWDDGQYVWDAYRIDFQAPSTPGQYSYVVKWAGNGGSPDASQELTIALSVE